MLKRHSTTPAYELVDENEDEEANEFDHTSFS
jgi:hypothetical protein